MVRVAIYGIALLVIGFWVGHIWPVAAPVMGRATMDATVTQMPARTETAVFGAGCFWGVEESFREVPGVVATAAGYSGGALSYPSYKDVSFGNSTDHVEVVLVTFDPARISYEQLLETFWACHDPTIPQGAVEAARDRSAIFYASPEQAAIANTSKVRHSAEYTKPIATVIRPATTFWRAEDYHQQYVEKNGGKKCRAPVGPKKVSTSPAAS